MREKQTVIIIGAGPAGLTAAYELSKSDMFKVIVVEAETQVGGISKTVDYKGNKIDIGGHRFFLSQIGYWSGGKISCLSPQKIKPF